MGNSSIDSTEQNWVVFLQNALQKKIYKYNLRINNSNRHSEVMHFKGNTVAKSMLL
jgi:hypothetical protein